MRKVIKEGENIIYGHAVVPWCPVSRSWRLIAGGYTKNIKEAANFGKRMNYIITGRRL